MLTYYDVRDTVKEVPNATVYYIVGQGGVGKTYSVKREILLNFFDTGKKFIYIKRFATEFAAGELNTVFADVVEDPEVKPLLEDKYNRDGKYHAIHILQTGAWFEVKGEDKDGKLTSIDKIGRIAAVNRAQRFKGGVYNDYNRILFDEFISDSGYIRGDGEPGELDKIIGTVARKDNPVRIYFCGNPDAPIEACPYLYPLKLDYAHMQVNTVYKYDTVLPNGKIIADNAVFIKLSNYSGNQYINEHAGYLFGTSAELVRMDGEVLTYDYIHLDYEGEGFRPEYELVVETPKITDTEYHVKLYVYYGLMWGEPACVVCKHRRYNIGRVLFCRYDKTDYRHRKERQTYRLNIPPHADFAKLRELMAYVDATQVIITADDQAATLFEHIRINK